MLIIAVSILLLQLSWSLSQLRADDVPYKLHVGQASKCAVSVH